MILGGKVHYQKFPEGEGVRFHEYANVFPMLTGEALEAFDQDVKENGVREPIVFYQGYLLDGRNRYMAARRWGIEYPYVEYEGENPLAYVISLNLTRRHLTESQRGMAASKLEAFRHGDNQHTAGDANLHLLDRGEAARIMNVSERTVATAAKVRDAGAPELVEAVETGKVSVSAAAVITELPKEEQVEVVAHGEREILQRAKEINADKAKIRRAQRIERIAEINKGNTELGTQTRYPIIYADPPWRYENPPIGSTSRAIENHYDTMTLEDICALPVAKLAADDALLYLWATAPKLAECMKVIEAWGFEYRTNMVWDKVKIGMGYHARNQHEILLIAKRGEIPPPEAGKQPSSVYREERTEHSAKPAFFAEMIEAAYPTLPKIELFCRSPREGWAVWGNQSGASDAA